MMTMQDKKKRQEVVREYVSCITKLQPSSKDLAFTEGLLFGRTGDQIRSRIYSCWRNEQDKKEAQTNSCGISQNDAEEAFRVGLVSVLGVKGWTAGDLAKASGVSRAAAYFYVKGDRVPVVEERARLIRLVSESDYIPRRKRKGTVKTRYTPVTDTTPRQATLVDDDDCYTIIDRDTGATSETGRSLLKRLSKEKPPRTATKP